MADASSANYRQSYRPHPRDNVNDFEDIDLEKSSNDREEEELATNKETFTPSSSPGTLSVVSRPTVSSRDSSPARSSTTNSNSLVLRNRRQAPSSYSAQAPIYQLSTEQRRTTVQAMNSLMEAAANGGVDQVEKLLASIVDIDKPDIDGLTALHHAATNGHIRVVALLVRHGASINAATPLGYTPLALAANGGHRAVVECLICLRHSSVLTDKNWEVFDGRTTGTSTAVSSEARSVASSGFTIFESMAIAYESQGKDKNVEDLANAVENGNLEGVVRMIAALTKAYASGSDITHLGDPEELREKMNGFLASACRTRHPDIALALLCAGAKVDSADKLGTTPLMHAVRNRQPLMVAALMKAGATADKTNKVGHSALTLAIDANDLAILKALVDGKADIWNATAWGEPLIYYAALNRKTEVVRALLDVHADKLDSDGSKALARYARAGSQAVVYTLLRAGADPHHRAADGHTAFTLAAANGHETILTTLLKKHGTVEWKRALQIQCDKQGRTALMLAALNQQEQTVRYLLDNHADAHQKDFSGRTAMLWAAAHGLPTTMDLLRHKGAKHVCTDDRGDTIFTIAAEHDNRAVIDLISTPAYANKQFDIDTPNKDGDTALIKAARRGFLEMVRLLNYKGASSLLTNNEGRTAIHEAAAHGHTDIVAYLQREVDALPKVYPYANGALSLLARMPLASFILPSRVPVRARELDAEGNSLMMVAAANGQEVLLRELFNRPLDADDNQDGYESALGGDADSNAFTLVSSRRAVALGSPSRINIEEKNLDGLTALCQATRNGQYAAIKFLIDQGAKVNGAFPTYAGTEQVFVTALWLAAKLTSCPAGNGAGGDAVQKFYTPEMVVRLLLENGARSDINTPCWQQRHTPLIAAAAAGRAEVVTLLIENGAQIDLADQHQLTPLIHAAWHGRRSVMEVLLNHGASPNVKPGELSALILAAEGGHEDVIQLLADRGADLDHADLLGTTALIGAAKRGKTKAVKRLIRLGAYIDHIDKRGNSALFYASRENHVDIVDLLGKGAPPPRNN